jgi:hypothetical protein
MERALRDYVSFIQLPDKGMGQQALMKEIGKYEKLGKLLFS